MASRFMSRHVAAFSLLLWTQLQVATLAFSIVSTQNLGTPVRLVSSSGTPPFVSTLHQPRRPTDLKVIRKLWKRVRGKRIEEDSSEPVATATVEEASVAVVAPEKETAPPTAAEPSSEAEEVSVCIIGGGVSGLVAGATCAKGIKEGYKVVLLEQSETLGGRVQSDVTEDGFVLDRGFAVFIEQYPLARAQLDYNALKLGSFLPGALVKLPNRFRLARVTDPLRQPEELFVALEAPVGGLFDKLKVLPLIYNVQSKTIGELFEERESTTMEALTDRWGFSEDMIEKFFKPFLEGIYLAPLEEQSSRMFSFVFKMFSEGAAALPEGGIGAVSQQLADKAAAAGVDLRTGSAVTQISSQEGGGFLVEIAGQDTKLKADSVVIATDGQVAQRMVAQLEGFESLGELPEQPQRSVGCLYYSFEGTCPVTDPILVLSGLGEDRGTKENPINNICFPSAVSKGYAPEGHGLCSVTVLQSAMDAFEGQDEALDSAVRNQLGRWFPEFKDKIAESWKLQRIYKIPNAQPSQLGGPAPASVNGGRGPSEYRGKKLPSGLLLCGDHMATATLNGAMESGFKAGAMAKKAVK